jgi:hypothetical protein
MRAVLQISTNNFNFHTRTPQVRRTQAVLISELLPLRDLIARNWPRDKPHRVVIAHQRCEVPANGADSSRDAMLCECLLDPTYPRINFSYSQSHKHQWLISIPGSISQHA